MKPHEYLFVASALGVMAVAVALVLGAAGKQGAPPAAFAGNLARWQSSGITSYALTIRELCECDTTPVRVVVRNRTVTEARFESETEQRALSAAEAGARALSIDQVFQRIEDAYRDGFETIEVIYDERYGYPIEALLDPSEAVVDDETRYVLSAVGIDHGG